MRKLVFGMALILSILASGVVYAVDVTGTWEGSYSDSETSGTVTYNVSQSGNRFTGSFSNSEGGYGKVQGTMTGRKMKTTLTSSVPGCSGTMSSNGVINKAGNRITGTYTGSDCRGAFTNGRVYLKKISK